MKSLRHLVCRLLELALFFLLCTGDANASAVPPSTSKASSSRPFPPQDELGVVYRAVVGPPNLVRLRGGFPPQKHPKQRHHFLGLWKYPGQLELVSETRRPFVVTLKSPDEAFIAKNRRASVQPPFARLSRSHFWLYKIRATPNMIDGSLLGSQHAQDVLSVGGIRWDQVIGYYYFPSAEAYYNSRIPLSDRLFHKNPHYHAAKYGNSIYSTQFPHGLTNPLEVGSRLSSSEFLDKTVGGWRAENPSWPGPFQHGDRAMRALKSATGQSDKPSTGPDDTFREFAERVSSKSPVPEGDLMSMSDDTLVGGNRPPTVHSGKPSTGPGASFHEFADSVSSQDPVSASDLLAISADTLIGGEGRKKFKADPERPACQMSRKRDSLDCIRETLVDERLDDSKSSNVKTGTESEQARPASVEKPGPSMPLKNAHVSTLDEAAAKANFERLASKYGIQGLKAGSREIQMPGLFATLQKHTRQRFWPLASAGTATLAMVGPYVADLIDVFSRESTPLERAEALTSIVPLVGCAVEARAQEEHRLKPDMASGALCLLADALTFTPLMPLGLILHAARVLFLEKELRFSSPEDAQATRDTAWQHRVQRFYLDLSKSAMTQWEFEMATILHEASTAAAAINATLALVPESPAGLHVADGTETNIEDKICNRIASRHLALRDELPMALHERLVEDALDFNELFISNVNSTMMEPSSAWTAQIDRHTIHTDEVNGQHHEPPYTALDADPQLRRQEWRELQAPLIGSIRFHLENNPPAVRDLQSILDKIRPALDHRFDVGPCQPSKDSHDRAIQAQKVQDQGYADALEYLRKTGH